MFMLEFNEAAMLYEAGHSGKGKCDADLPFITIDCP
jgi:hypothetical protein